MKPRFRGLEAGESQSLLDRLGSADEGHEDRQKQPESRDEGGANFPPRPLAVLGERTIFKLKVVCHNAPKLATGGALSTLRLRDTRDIWVTGFAVTGPITRAVFQRKSVDYNPRLLRRFPFLPSRDARPQRDANRRETRFIACASGHFSPPASRVERRRNRGNARDPRTAVARCTHRRDGTEKDPTRSSA